MRIATFNVDDDSAFLGEFIRIVGQLSQNGMILDVRGNLGGLIHAGERLLQLLTPRPIEPCRFHFLNSTRTEKITQRRAFRAWNESNRHAARGGIRGAVHVGRRRVRGVGGECASFRRRVDRESRPAVLDPGVALDRVPARLPERHGAAAVRGSPARNRRPRRSGADTLVQVTPDLTYAEYAPRGFFELVVAVVLVVPVLLAADWLLDRRSRRDAVVFRGLAGVQIGLVLAITASALQRLRLYHASYGLTESRFDAMVLLIWIGAMLFWLAATVLRGRRDSFAFGTLASGLATVALLFVINPDAVIARANVARMASADAPVRFDVAYATSLSADAVPVLIEALSALPRDVQCPLARHMLRRWPPDGDRSIRSWNWSAARASDAVREHEARLRSMVGRDGKCATPGAG